MMLVFLTAHASQQRADVAPWCTFRVALPHCDWPSVVATLTSLPNSDSAIASSAASACGSDCLALPGGISVHIVENALELPAALQALRDSMQDALVAIDLEWRPDFGAGQSRVALMQLATSSCAVLIRTCRLKHQLPPSLLDFLRDPNIVLCGFGWDGADENKMQASFNIGRALFAHYLDLQRVSLALGYHRYGLGSLTGRVLGFTLPKPRKVSMSNWEARRLTQGQIIYAALDALITGQIFRALRLWHSSTSACSTCHSLIGSLVECSSLRCGHEGCNRMFGSMDSLEQHARSASHKISVQQCPGCGRLTHAP
ncbi:probable exonuclease 3'-5' domain-containing protein 2 [Coccomyxa sp. Obi]|nr:probable exonuclease 3'-5' domain-containing protein 2 [Coccomyxa sp. Obi]